MLCSCAVRVSSHKSDSCLNCKVLNAVKDAMAHSAEYVTALGHRAATLDSVIWNMPVPAGSSRRAPKPGFTTRLECAWL